MHSFTIVLCMQSIKINTQAQAIGHIHAPTNDSTGTNMYIFYILEKNNIMNVNYLMLFKQQL